MASLTQEPDDISLTHSREHSDSSWVDDWGIDGLRFGDANHTALLDGEEFWGQGAYISLERDAKHYNFDIDYYLRSPTFRADNGFISSNNSQSVGVWQGYNFYFTDNRFVDRVLPALSLERTQNYDGTVKSQWINPWVDLSLKAQTSVWLSYNLGRETFGDRQQEFTGIGLVQMNVNSSLSKPLRVGFYVESGRRIRRDRSNPLLGQGYYLSVYGTIKPTQRLVIEPDIDYSSLDYPADTEDFPSAFDETDGTPAELAGTNIFRGYILRTRINYQFTRELFVRVILQYDEFNQQFAIDPLLTYRINPFSAFYVGSALGYQDYGTGPGIASTNRTYFFKLQYLFNM